MSIRSRASTKTLGTKGWPPKSQPVADGTSNDNSLAALAPGARLSISDPKNFFELRRDADEYLLVAGGIGVTPLVSMAIALARDSARVRMVYVAQAESELAFRGELETALGERLFTVVGRRGLDLRDQIARLAPRAEAYVCGPIGLLEAAQHAWLTSGRSRAQLRFETFGNSGHAAAQPFWVKLPRHGIEITVSPETTLLDALADAGVDVLYDCKRGECGLCTLEVMAVEGEIDHRDVFLSDAERRENRKVCACVSRAVNGGLVLDSDFRPD